MLLRGNLEHVSLAVSLVVALMRWRAAKVVGLLNGHLNMWLQAPC